MAFRLQNTRLYRGYSEESFPLGSYALLLGTFTTAATTLLASTRKKKVHLGWSDVALIGIATHKLTRLISRDVVTAVVRAPFTRFQGHAPASEVDEQSRGTGLRKATGQLLGCQYCLGPWVATALTSLRVHLPKQARIATTVLGAVAISDFLHRAFQMFGAELQQAYSERDILQKAARSETVQPPPTKREELERGVELR